MPKALYFISLLVVMTFLIALFMAIVPDVIGRLREWISDEEERP